MSGPDDDPDFGRQISESAGSSTRALESPRDDAFEARRQELQAREAELRKQELEAWEADLERRETELRREDGEGPADTDD